jgi:endonuclease-3
MPGRDGQKRRAMVQIRLPQPLPFAQQVAIFSHLAEANPRPQTELEWINPFTLVVAVALSAQATDVGVNKATKALFAIADTPQKMLDLGLESVTEHIRTIGLYRQKAKNVIALSGILVDEFGGEVPDSRAALMRLPGVGRKTANVVLNTAFGHPAQAVDTHIFRVGNRTRIAPGRDVDEVERAIEDNVPARFQDNAHHWLILHGRYICQARRPRCAVCIIHDLCPFEEKTA